MASLISTFDNFSNFSTVWWFCVYCKVSFYYKDYKVRTASHLLGRVVMADKVRALKEDGDENSSTFYIFWIKLTLCSVLSLSPSLWILAYFAISSLWYQPWNLTIQPQCPLLLMHPPCNLHESASACALLSSEHASRQSRKRRKIWINIVREHSVTTFTPSHTPCMFISYSCCKPKGLKYFTMSLYQEVFTTL